MNRFVQIAALLLIFSMGFAGCVTIEDLIGGGEQQEPDVQATPWDGPRVRPGIALAISVTAAGVTSREAKQYFVDAEGCITMELVGTVQCNKLTLIDLQKKIEEAYKAYYVDPSVTATFVYQPNSNMISPWGTVTVLGEVGRPGQVDMPATQELPILKALQLAGGVNSIADKRRIKVTRCLEDGTQKKTRVNLFEIGEDGRSEKNISLKAGDVVWVPMSWY